MLPSNIETLAEKNQAVLERLSFQEGDDPFELCNRDSYMQTGLFPEEIVDDIFSFSGETTRVESDFVPGHIGMILLRPEMTHMTREFETFIGEHFTVCHSENVQMTSEKYWNIYKHDLYRPETLHSRLTRAAIYIGSTCRLLVFKDINYRLNEKPISDRTFEFLKGTQGVYKKGTLRGELVYDEAVALEFHKINDMPKMHAQLCRAIDPFSAYRRLSVRDEGAHVGLEHPLLFYTAVGVHVPNAEEIHTDLAQFLNDSDIGSL